MNCLELKNKIADNTVLYTVAIHEKRDINENLKTTRKALVELRHSSEIQKKALLVMEYLIHRNYEKVISLFEDTITAALIDMFDDQYKFKFEIGKRGDSTTCDFNVSTDSGKHYHDVKMSQGTSVANIIGVVMRLVIVKLDRHMPNLILLDEPLSGLQVHRQELAGRFLNKICKEFGVQLIVVSQSPQFTDSIEHTIKVEKDNGRKSIGIKV